MKELKFVDFCKTQGYSDENINKFKKAIEFSENLFNEKKRLSGESLIDRNIHIGKILVKNKLFPEVVIAGLLYGIEEEVSEKEIEKNFDKEISKLVFGIKKLKEIKSKNKNTEMGLLREIIITAIDDLRIIFIKLASKLHNLDSINIHPKKERERIAREVLEIYSPLGNRLGLEILRRELEDKAFKILNPRKYNEINNFLKESHEKRRNFINKILKEVKEKLEKEIKVLNVKGREKHIYSIYKKIKERRVPLDEQKDHFAMRIIVNSVRDCYTCLGVLHQYYESLGEIKDYIEKPKNNGYQSLHTFIKINEKTIEVQIRTQKMDEVAEEGAAAHWSYKKLKSKIGFEKKTALYRDLLYLDKKLNKNDFLNTIKNDLFGEQIYCYTPQGKVISLPKGASVLDFAYHIHQEIGNTAIGARINGAFTSLKKELSQWDVVEIITNKKQRPKRKWISYVVSAKAKSAIKKAVKKYEGFSVPSKKQEEGSEMSCDNLVVSEDFPNHDFFLARCCFPIPKDDLAGVLKSHKKVLVHKKDCEKIKDLEDKTIDVKWKETFNCPIKFFVRASSKSGILAEILNAVSRQGFTIKEANAKLIEDDVTECKFIIMPKDIDSIESLVKKIQNIKDVKRVFLG